MKRKQKRSWKNTRVMGHTIFVPLDDALEVTIIPNFHTQNCKWCEVEFHSFRPDASYCSESHRCAAGMKRSRKRMKDLEEEVVRLRELVNGA